MPRVFLALASTFLALAATATVIGAQSTRAQSVLPAPAPRGAHAMVWDETNKVVLLFGGAGAARFRDLWAWDGSRWTQLANSGPAPRDDALFVHDPVRARTLLFGGRGGPGLLGDTWEWDGSAWQRRNVPGPGARLHASAAFDRAAGRVRVYGGSAPDGSELSDTWEWDGTSWTKVAELGAVPGWLPNRMAWDAARRRTLLHVFDPASRLADGTQATELWEWAGGAWRPLASAGPGISPVQDLTTLGAAGGLLLVDGGALQGHARGWVWQKGAWTLASGSPPPPRNGHALAWDPERARVVLFGGFREGLAFGDTWEWDGRDWRCLSEGARATAPTRPEQAFAAALAFDSGRGRLVVFGGEASGGRSTAATWEWDGARWRRPATSGPSARYWGAMAHDPRRGQSVLFGGLGTGGVLGDTWEWDGSAWRRVPVPGPSARYAHELAWDPALGRVVLFGGRDTVSTHGDLWAFDGSRWELLAQDGPGPRFTHALSWDQERGELLAFGGHGPLGALGTLAPLGDLWARAGGAWTELAAPGPGPMDHVGAAFDAARGRLVIVNGGPGSGPRTWEWDGTAWRGLVSSLGELNGGHRLAYDASRGQVLLWTGVPGSETASRLLAWDGVDWTRVDG